MASKSATMCARLSVAVSSIPRAVAFASLLAIVFVLGGVWWHYCTPAATVENTVPVRLIDGADQATAEWCVLRVTDALDDPPAVVWLAVSVAEHLDPAPTEPWLVVLRAEYRAPNRQGVTQRFVVRAVFRAKPARNDDRLTLVSVQHTPPLPGVDFDRL